MPRFSHRSSQFENSTIRRRWAVSAAADARPEVERGGAWLADLIAEVLADIALLHLSLERARLALEVERRGTSALDEALAELELLLDDLRRERRPVRGFAEVLLP